MKIALFSHFSAGSDMPVHKKLAVFVEKLFLKNNCIKRPNFLLVVEALSVLKFSRKLFTSPSRF